MIRTETHNDEVIVSLKNADQYVSAIVTILNERQGPDHLDRDPQAHARGCLPLLHRKDHPEQEQERRQHASNMRMHQKNDEALIMDIIYTIWLRSMKRFIRSKSRIIGSIGMPLFFLLFLGFGLNSVVQMPGLGGNYLVFLIPGMVAMSVMFTVGLLRHPDHLGQAVRVS